MPEVTQDNLKKTYQDVVNRQRAEANDIEAQKKLLKEANEEEEKLSKIVQKSTKRKE